MAKKKPARLWVGQRRSHASVYHNPDTPGWSHIIKPWLRLYTHAADIWFRRSDLPLMEVAQFPQVSRSCGFSPDVYHSGTFRASKPVKQERCCHSETQAAACQAFTGTCWDIQEWWIEIFFYVWVALLACSVILHTRLKASVGTSQKPRMGLNRKKPQAGPPAADTVAGWVKDVEKGRGGGLGGQNEGRNAARKQIRIQIISGHQKLHFIICI